MKKSNQWLLGFVFFSFLFALAIHGVLYSELRKGHLVTSSQIHDESFVKLPITTPRVISFDGDIWVNLVPADQFALELPRVNKDADAGIFQIGPTANLKVNKPEAPAISWHVSGDTLFVKGNIDRPLHRPWSAWYYRNSNPQVSILGPAVDEVLINNSQIYLQGTRTPGDKRSTRIVIRNSTLWIGMQYENGHKGPNEFFDSLDIHSANTITLINGPAVIDHLQMTLTDSSLVNDQYATLHSSVIESSPESRVEFTSSNLKKNQLIIR